jgi:rod shape-determining protein MreB
VDRKATCGGIQTEGVAVISVFKFIRSQVAGGLFYVKLRRIRLHVRNVAKGTTYDDEPLIALTRDAKPRVAAIGASARSSGLPTVNPFEHPRILVADFRLAELIMSHAFQSVSPVTWLRPAPVVVCHVLEPLAGGLSQIELRALHELLNSAGAREVHFWEGGELSDEELRTGVYRPAAGGANPLP